LRWHGSEDPKEEPTMPQYDASNAECLVFSYKDGLLSKMAHDLKHRATRFAIAVDEYTGSIHAEIDARSLRVESVMKEGREVPDGLNDADKKKIEGQIIGDVLRADHNPLITFQSTFVASTPEGFEIEGVLELNACARPVTTVARRVNGRYIAELTVHQPDYNITPFSAMMGALKIKPDVVVRLVVPAA
jgi:hypothetical protein